MLYANSYAVTYRKSEFLIELRLEGPKGIEKTETLYTSPEYAKMLYRLLEVMIREYEEKFGKLPEQKIVKEKEGKRGYSPSMVA